MAILSVAKKIRQGSYALVTEPIQELDLELDMEGVVLGHVEFKDEVSGEKSWMSLVRFEHGDFWLYPDQIKPNYYRPKTR